MTTKSPDFYESNMKLLKNNHLQAWKMITDKSPDPIGQILIADDGMPNLSVETENKQILFFHDQRNTQREAEEFLKIVPEDAKGTVIFQGMGLGFGPVAIIKEREDIQHLILFELSVGIFLQALKATDLTPLLSDSRVIISLGENPDVGTILSGASTSMRLEEISMLTHAPSCSYQEQEYDNLGKEIYNIANQQNIAANTFKAFGSTFVTNRLSFLSMIHHTSLIDSLKDKFKNVPALLVATGPSLNKNIKYIPCFKDKAVILSVDSALPALLAKGVAPDFVSSIDYERITYEKIASSAPKSHGISLICSSWVGPKVAKIFPAENIYWTFTGGAMERWINRGLGGNLVAPGAGTVAHLNLVAAIIMGCSPIILVGQDLAFTQGSADHAENISLRTDDQTAGFLENKEGVVWVDANYGDKLPSDRSFLNYINHFESIMANNPGHYINASEGGAYIKGTEVMRLKEVLDQYCTEDFNVTKQIKKFNQESTLGNIDHFLSEIRGILKTIQKIKTYIEKTNKLSDFINGKLLKLKKSTKKCSGFNDLPPDLQKKISDFDKGHGKLDKEYRFWELFDETTVNALQFTERMKYETNKLQNMPGRYIDWLLGHLKRLEEVNRIRSQITDVFGGQLSDIVKHHKKESELLRQLEPPGGNKTGVLSALAKLYAESDDLVLARPILEQIISKDPENTTACLYLGIIAAHHTEYDKADAYFNKLMANDPGAKTKVEKIRQTLADEYFGYASRWWKNDRTTAKNMMLKGLQCYPQHTVLLKELSAILEHDMVELAEITPENIKEKKSAIVGWMEIFKNQPLLEKNLQGDALGAFHRNCGKFFLVSKDYLKAFESISKAISIHPENPEYHLLISDLLLEMGKKDQAALYYNRALKIDPAFVEVYENGKKSHVGIEETITPDDLNRWISSGDRFFINHQFESAVACYEKVLKFDPENATAIHNMGAAFKEMGKADKAIECYNRVISIVPEYYNAYYNKGVALQVQGKNDAAIIAYKKSLELKPDFLHALNNLGNIYHSLGYFQEAIDAYKKILEIDPGYADAFNNLGIVYQRMGMLAETVSCYKQFLEIRPENQQVRANLNRILQSGNYSSE